MINVLIYGAGAIGSFLGYLLSETGGKEGQVIENVALLGRGSHIEKIRLSGLKIGFDGESKIFRFRHCYSSLDEFNASDFSPRLIFISVKTHSLSQVGHEIKESGMLARKVKDSKFILLMNGMGNRDLFDLGSSAVFEGITSIGAVFSGDGQIELKGRGNTVFDDIIGGDIKEFLELRFNEKGFEIEFEKDFKYYQWNKLFANAIINPITAITGETNDIVQSKHLEGIVEMLIEECISVAEKEGYRFEKNTVLKFILSVTSKTSSNTSSMLQDIRNGKKTEIESINGYVIRLARKYAMNVPVNETLYALLKVVESSQGARIGPVSIITDQND